MAVIKFFHVFAIVSIVLGEDSISANPEDPNAAGARSSDCSVSCSPAELITELFCGSDGKPYNSLCELKKTSCEIGQSIARVDGEDSMRCHNRTSCPVVCLGIQDPVCGTDGLIYPNKCLLLQKNCGRDVKEQPMAECIATLRRGRKLGSEDECPITCTHQLYQPICGSDGSVYANSCAIRQQNCAKREKEEERIYEVPSGLCARPSRCPRSCVPIPDPVCASDGKVYLNECQMHQKNCGRKVSRVPVTSCL